MEQLDFNRIGLLLHIEELVRNHPKLLDLKSMVLEELEGHNKIATEVKAEIAKTKAAEEAEAAHRAAVEAKARAETNQPVARPAPIYPADSGVIQSPSILNESSAVDRRI